jgi:energy-coupling factor transporter transmembrane protein EcfT
VVVVPHTVQPLAPQPAGCCACCVVPSYCGLIALSCFVFWCCGWVFGLIAFILALVGQSQESSGQVLGGRGLAKGSFWVSIAGIIVGTILIVLIIIVMVASPRRCVYNYRGDYVCH